MSDTPTSGLGVFDPRNDDLILSRAANGGYVIQRVGGLGIIPEVIGAFSNAADMLAALTHVFLPNGCEVPHV